VTEDRLGKGEDGLLQVTDQSAWTGGRIHILKTSDNNQYD